MANAAQTATAGKKTDERKTAKKFNTGFASWVIVLALAAAIVIFLTVFGNPANFQDAAKEHPIGDGSARQYLGIVYKGGFVVPILLSLVIMNIAFGLERFFTLRKASGKSRVDTFIGKVRAHLRSNNVDAALKECDSEKGSVANVVKATLIRYKEMESATHMDVDQRILAIQKEVEEATNLELPMLEQNLVILATMGSVSTLTALFGTTLGMIRAFAALGGGSTPDSAELATGISEALVNTALGIGNAAVSIILYNVFTTKIDKMTYAIDEASYSIVQTFAEKHS